jgi:hypothetical protein
LGSSPDNRPSHRSVALTVKLKNIVLCFSRTFIEDSQCDQTVARLSRDYFPAILLYGGSRTHGVLCQQINFAVYVIQDYPPVVDAVLLPTAFVSRDETPGKNMSIHPIYRIPSLPANMRRYTNRCKPDRRFSMKSGTSPNLLLAADHIEKTSFFEVPICSNNKVLRAGGTVHDGRTLLYRASKLACDVCALENLGISRPQM